MSTEKLQIITRLKKYSSEQLQTRLKDEDMTILEIEITEDILKNRGVYLDSELIDTLHAVRLVPVVRSGKVGRKPKEPVTFIKHDFIKGDKVRFMPNKSSKQLLTREYTGEIVGFTKSNDNKLYCRIKLDDDNRIVWKQVGAFVKIIDEVI